MKILHFQHITASQVEDMMNQIALRSSRAEARRFNKLSFEKKQKVTLILKRREKRMKDPSAHIDAQTIKEVISNAQEDFFIFE